MDGVDQARDGGANPDADGTDEQDGERRRDQHYQHGLQEVLGHRRGDAIDPALYVGEAPGHHQGRDHGIGVFHRGDRDQGEGHLLPLGGPGHQLDEAGVHQHAGDGDGERHIGLELDGGGGGHHQGQEEEGAVTGHSEYGEGRGSFLQHPCHLQHHGQQLEHGAADDGRNEGRHGADQGVQNGGAHAAQAETWLGCRHVSLCAFRQLGKHLAIGVGDHVADDHLALVITADHPKYPGSGLERWTVHQGGVLQHEAQARHAVGHGDYVAGSAEGRDDLAGQGRVVL
ncbi:hypothetical protein D3C80_912040 [compost metagenome]